MAASMSASVAGSMSASMPLLLPRRPSRQSSHRRVRSHLDGGRAHRRFEGVFGWPEATRHLPEHACATRPLSDHTTVWGTKVVAAPGKPHGALHPLVDSDDE